MKENKTIEVLDLRNNSFNVVALMHLAEVLKHNHTIRTLHLFTLHDISRLINQSQGQLVLKAFAQAIDARPASRPALTISNFSEELIAFLLNKQDAPDPRSLTPALAAP